MQGARRLPFRLSLATVATAAAAASIALAAFAPFASAASGEDASTFTADAIGFPGRARAWSGNTGLFFDAPAGGNALATTFEAGLAEVRVYQREWSCSSSTAGIPGFCTPFDPSEQPDERFTVASLVLAADGETARDFELALASAEDRTHEATAAFSAETVSGSSGWRLADALDRAFEQGREETFSLVTGRADVPREEDFEVAFTAIRGNAEGEALALYVRGVAVRVSGEDLEEREIETGFTRESTAPGAPERFSEVVVFVVAQEAARATFEFDGTGVLFGVPQLVTYDGMSVAGGEGALRSADREFTLDGDSLVPGEFSIVPVAAEQERIRVQASPATAAPPPPTDEPARDPVAVAGLVGGAVLGLASLGALAYWWPLVRFGATALALPLYSRIEKDAVLNHEKREEIYGLIRGAPGIHAHEISSKANIGWGTTVYHLKLLEEHSLVVSKRAGRYKRFFPSGGATGGVKEAYGALRNDTTARVADFVRRTPGASQKDVCDALGISPSLVSWHVERLEEAGLVKKVKEGRRVRYFAGAAWASLDLGVVPALAATPAAAAVPIVAGGHPAPSSVEAPRGET